MNIFGSQKSTSNVLLSMEQRITLLEAQVKRFESYSSRTAEFHDALYDYLGIEAQDISGIVFVEKGKAGANIVEQERQKWVRACRDFGGEDEGSTAHKIMQKGLA